MADLQFVRTDMGLAPSDPVSREWFGKLRSGAVVNVKATVARNPRFHRKFFAMLNTAYENHDWPKIPTEHGDAQCSFDMFRRYVTIKAGFFTIGVTPQGVPRAEPKSIAFGRMDEAEFEKVYSAVLDVILAEFLDNWTTADMERAIEHMLSFA